MTRKRLGGLPAGRAGRAPKGDAEVKRRMPKLNDAGYVRGNPRPPRRPPPPPR